MTRVPHAHNCKKVPQTEIKRIDLKKPLDEDLIRKTQTGTVITSSKGSTPKLPEDADTIPPLSERTKNSFAYAEGRARHFSRSEAIRRILKDELILHRDEIKKRDAEIEKLLADLFGIDQYFITPESYLTDFMDIFASRRGATWIFRKLARRIKKVYGFSVCSGCLHEAKYIWRQYDIIESYRQCSKK